MYDMKNLARIERLAENSPESFAGYQVLDAGAFEAGAIPLKYKELIAVAVAVATQCAYCLTIHGEKARDASATEKELSEAVMIAVALRAGGALTHAVHALGEPRPAAVPR